MQELEISADTGAFLAGRRRAERSVDIKLDDIEQRRRCTLHRAS